MKDALVKYKKTTPLLAGGVAAGRGGRVFLLAGGVAAGRGGRVFLLAGGEALGRIIYFLGILQQSYPKPYLAISKLIYFRNGAHEYLRYLRILFSFDLSLLPLV